MIQVETLANVLPGIATIEEGKYFFFVNLRSCKCCYTCKCASFRIFMERYLVNCLKQLERGINYKFCLQCFKKKLSSSSRNGPMLANLPYQIDRILYILMII